METSLRTAESDLFFSGKLFLHAREVIGWVFVLFCSVNIFLKKKILRELSYPKSKYSELIFFPLFFSPLKCIPLNETRYYRVCL